MSKTFAPLVNDTLNWFSEEQKPLSRIIGLPGLNTAVNGTTPQSKNAEYGFEANAFNLVTAETGVGKSTFMIHALGSFVLANEPCLFYSLEMDRAQVMSQFWAWQLWNNDINSNWPEWKIRMYQRVIATRNTNQGKYPEEFQNGGKITEEVKKDIEKMEEQITVLSSMLPVSFSWGRDKVFLEDTFKDVENAVLGNQVRHIFLDHLGVLKTKQKFTNSIQKEEYILEQIEHLWKEYGVTVWLATQFSKGVNRGGKSGERTAQDISGTAAIPNLAFNIIYLYTSEEQNNTNRASFQNNIKTKELTLKLLKSRKGNSLFKQNVLMDVNFKTFAEKPEK